MKSAVLLVDDDQNLLHGLARALRAQPYNLFTARSGDEALHVLKSHAIHVLVTDEQMPGMSGGDLLAWAAENRPEVVRMMITGNASAMSAIRAINEGRVFHFFTKPCDAMQLAIMIRKALEHQELVEDNRHLLRKCRSAPQQPERLLQQLDVLSKIVAEQLRGPLEAAHSDQHGPSVSVESTLRQPSLDVLRQALAATDVVQQLIDGLKGHFPASENEPQRV